MGNLWKKGESGNPFGRRPNLNAFRALCQSYTKQAFDMLVEIVENRATHESVRVQGLRILVEHGWGKPPQSIEVKTVEGMPPDMMTTEQLRLAAAGQTRDLVCSLIEEGKFDEYIGRYEVVDEGSKRLAMSSDKDIGDFIKDDVVKDSSEGTNGAIIQESKEAGEAQG